jgi:predicted nucleotidyltransferase
MSQVRVTYPALTREQVIRRLKHARVNLEKRLPVSRIILYGSYAEGRYTASSDIDVIVVYEGKERPDAYKIVMDEARLPRLEPKIYTVDQFNALTLQSPRFAAILQKEGIVIS